MRNVETIYQRNSDMVMIDLEHLHVLKFFRTVYTCYILLLESNQAFKYMRRHATFTLSQFMKTTAQTTKNQIRDFCPMERHDDCLPANKPCEQVEQHICNMLLCAYTTGKQDAIANMSNDDDVLILTI